MDSEFSFDSQIFSLIRSHEPFHMICFEWDDHSGSGFSMVHNIHYRPPKIIVLQEGEKNLILSYARALKGEGMLFGDESVYHIRRAGLHQGRHLLCIHNASTQIEEFRRWHRKAFIDDLTGLGNRRRVMHIIEVCIAAKCEYTIALFDLDGLKKVNDRFGHHAGDACICTLADILRRYERKDAPACRIGGDEFILLFGQEHDVKSILDEISFEFSRCIHPDHPVSVTTGCATFGNLNQSAYEILNRADKEMYGNKYRRKADSLVPRFLEDDNSILKKGK